MFLFEREEYQFKTVAITAFIPAGIVVIACYFLGIDIGLTTLAPLAMVILAACSQAVLSWFLLHSRYRNPSTPEELKAFFSKWAALSVACTVGSILIVAPWVA